MQADHRGTLRRGIPLLRSQPIITKTMVFRVRLGGQTDKDIKQQQHTRSNRTTGCLDRLVIHSGSNNKQRKTNREKGDARQ